MSDTQNFLALANAMLMHLYDQIEPAYDDGDISDIELETDNGLLTIEVSPDITIVISRHEASRQLWIASWRLGGLHFSYDPNTERWCLADGTELKSLLEDELYHSVGRRFIL